MLELPRKCEGITVVVSLVNVQCDEILNVPLRGKLSHHPVTLLFVSAMVDGENPSDGGCGELEDAEHVAAQRREFLISERAPGQTVVNWHV